MTFKPTFLLFTTLYLLSSCSFTSNMNAASNLERMQRPRYQYIYDSRIRLNNKSERTLYADVIAEVAVYEMNPVDPSDTMNIVNVKKIRIPAGKSLSLILSSAQPYKLIYGFISDDEKNQSHDFTPTTSRK